MKLMLQAIKALFRKVWAELAPLSARITTAQNTALNASTKATKAQSRADEAYSQAVTALNTANKANTEANKGLKAYDFVASIKPKKNSLLDVGEKTYLLEYPSNLGNLITRYKRGDCIYGSYLSIYSADGSSSGYRIKLTHTGASLEGGVWATIDGMARYYWVQIAQPGSTSCIWRYV